MKKLFTPQFRRKITFLLTFVLFSGIAAQGQTTINTTTGLSNTQDAATITFNFQNTNAFPVIITDVEGILNAYGYGGAELWYKTTAVNGLPGAISVANGWTQAATTNVYGIANTTTLITQSLFSNLALTIPANTTYGLSVSATLNGAGTLRAASVTGSPIVSSGGCNIIMGANAGYSGTLPPPAAPVTTQAGWLGKVRFIPGSPCSGTPDIPVISGPAAICSNTLFTLSATGYALGSGYTFQWQYFNIIAATWQPVLGATTPSSYVNTTGITAATQYRLVSTCTNGNVQSISNVITVGLGGGLAGVYTINKNAPSSATNFVSFASASAALGCGVTGPVTLNVVPGDAPYNEPAYFRKVPGASAVNKIRLNGNGAIVQYPTSLADLAILTMHGTKYMTVDSLVLRSLVTGGYCYGALLRDTTRYDSVTRCFFDMRSLESSAGIQSCGISLSSNLLAGTGLDSNSISYSYIGYNHIQGTNNAGGPQYGILCGDGYYSLNYQRADTNNVIDHNEVENFYTYGIYLFNNNGTKITNNNIHRKNKTVASNFWGIYAWGGWSNFNTPALSSNPLLISGNRIHSPAGSGNSVNNIFYGIYAFSNTANNNNNQSNIYITNNAIYNVTQGGTASNYGILFGGNNYINNNNLDTTFVYHNTIDFSQNINAGGFMAGLYCFDYNNVNSNDGYSIVKNNMVTITGGTTGEKYGVYRINNNSVNPGDNDFQRNNIYVNSAQPGNQYYARYGTVNYASLAAFQLAYPLQEIGSLSVQPQYTNPATGDFTPTNYALLGNGLNLQTLVPKDILGRPRSTAPTPGAFEIATDAGVTALIAPLGTYCSSVKEVKVAIVNAGVTTINTVQIQWSLNGVLQTPVTFNGVLQGILGSPNSAVISLGNGLFLPNTPVVIKAWTYMPNGQMDAFPANDTLVVTTQSSTSVPINLGPDAAICTGNTITLDAGYPGSVYLWDNPAINTQVRTISAAGTYYIRVTALDGCIGVDTFNLTLRPLPVVNLGPDVEICLGQTYTFDAGYPGSAYLWDDGSTGQTRTVDTAGYYEAQVTDIYGCMGYDGVNVGMKDIPGAEGVNATHADSGTYTFYPINPLYTYSYTWNFGDGSPEVTGYMVQHTYTALGIYTVTLHLEGECTGLIIDKSRTVDVFSIHGEGTGIPELYNGNGLTVYPNPANEWIIVETTPGLRVLHIAAYNVLGQKVYDTPAGKDNKHRIATGALPAGMYTLKIQTEEGTYITRKFEVVK